MTPQYMFANLGSILASLMFIRAMFQQYFPYQLQNFLEKYSQKLMVYFYPYIQVRFNEFTGERLTRSEAYSAIENYLSSTTSMQAKRLKAEIGKNNQSLVLSMDDNEEVGDVFKGVKLCELLEETDMTPADVAEHLMPKTISGDATFCLESLIQGLEKAKEEAKLKAEVEAKRIEQSAKAEAQEQDK
ncbi:AAA-ATPase At3g28580-like [Fagus crenata]